jgi:hypothetical protein
MGVDALAEIKRLYYQATPGSIQRDLARAVAFLKEMPADQRDRAAVYMDGLSQMRSEWASRKPAEKPKAPAQAGKTREG